MDRLTAFEKKIKGKKFFAGALASAVSGVLAYSSFAFEGFEWLAWIALTPFFLALEFLEALQPLPRAEIKPEARQRRSVFTAFPVFSAKALASSALLGLAFGAVFYALVFKWVPSYEEEAHYIVVGFAASFPAVFAALYNSMKRVFERSFGRRTACREKTGAGTAGLAGTPAFNAMKLFTKALAAPSAWLAARFTYSFNPLGASWTDLGIPLAGTPLFNAIAPVAGAPGVTFLVVAVNAIAALAVKTVFLTAYSTSNFKSRAARLLPALAAFSAFSGFIALNHLPPGFQLSGFQGSEANEKENPVVEVALVQQSFDDWPLVYSNEEVYKRLVAYADASIEATRSQPEPELIVWPEYALSTNLFKNVFAANALASTAKKTRSWLVLGSATPVNKNMDLSVGTPAYDTVFVFSPEGRLEKVHVALETIPFSDVAENPVKEPALVNASFTKFTETRRTLFATLTCFEDIEAWIPRKAVLAGAQFLVVSANDGTFNDSIEARLHSMVSKARAVEFKRWIARASNRGYSQVIDSSGFVRAATRLNERVVLRSKVKPESEVTFYAQTGDVLPAACLFAVAATFIAAVKQRTCRKQKPMMLG